jgi:hypothetical protein
MGLYDEVHFGNRCGQVKCLGKGMRAYAPGDHVVLHALPTGSRLAEVLSELSLAQQVRQERQRLVERTRIASGDRREFTPTDEQLFYFGVDGHTNDAALSAIMFGDESDVASWQIKMDDGYVLCVNQTLFAWAADPDPDLPVVNNVGQALECNPGRVGRIAVPRDCETCADLSGSTN